MSAAVHALHAVAATGHETDKLGARRSHIAAESSGSEAKLEAASSPAQPGPQDPGTKATFSPSSMKALEDAALDIAGTAKEWVHDIGDVAVDIVSTAADAVDEVGAGAAQLITSGADALVKGVHAARAGVNAAATVASDVVTDVTGRVGEAVESAVGYAALAALAGGALLNELV